MKRLRSHAIGVDSGEVVPFSDFEQNGVMWVGQGPRMLRSYVAFSESFAAPPSVRVAFTMWDVSNDANIRLDISAEDVTEKGFALIFRTWSDTRVARCRVAWQAIGEVPDEDVWDID